MKKVGLLILGLFCVSVAALAGELITNDTGEDVTGLHVVFSTPVLITAFGDILTRVDQTSLSYEFVFSGGAVEPWGSHWLSWAPATAQIMSYEWLRSASVGQSGTAKHQVPQFFSLDDINWDELPFVFEYQEGVEGGFGEGAPEDLSEAARGGKTGPNLRGVKVAFSGDQIAVRFETYGSVQDEYDYVLWLNEGNRGLTSYLIRLSPSNRAGSLSCSHPESHETIPPSQFLLEQNAVSALITGAAFGIQAVEPLKYWMMSVDVVNSGEWFSYPGRGPYIGWEYMMASHASDFRDALAFEGSTTPSDSELHPPWLYEYLQTAPSEQLLIPVFVSAPAGTALDDSFRVRVNDENVYPLERLSATMLGTQVAVSQLLQALTLEILREDEVLDDSYMRHVWNSSQAITIGLSEFSEEESVGSLPEDFMLGIRPFDVWGSFIYGLPVFWQEGHTREFVCETLSRIAAVGGTDVVMTSFYGWAQAEPLPVIAAVPSGGTVTISLSDLQRIVQLAHEMGLNVSVTFNNDVEVTWPPPDMSYLSETHKPAAWVAEFFRQARELLVREAGKCEQADVDRFIVDLGGYHNGNETLWAEEVELLLQELHEQYSGELTVRLTHGDVMSIIAGEVPFSSFQGADSFVTAWDLSDHGAGWSDDSIKTLALRLRNQALPYAAFKSLTDAPLYVSANFMSYDGYAADGWFDAVMESQEGHPDPDFIEQANAYEALFLFCEAYRVFDGIISFMYHWDDPFGPELSPDSSAQMDLSGSIRNKPAEAVFAKWAGSLGDISFSEDCERKSLAEKREENRTQDLICEEIADDFERETLELPLGLWVDDLHCEGGSTYPCGLRLASDNTGTSYLAAEGQSERAWYITLSFSSPVDARELAGIGITSWSETEAQLEIVVECRTLQGERASFYSDTLDLDPSPTNYSIPFSWFVSLAPTTPPGIPVEYLAEITALKFGVRPGTHIVNVDNLCWLGDGSGDPDDSSTPATALESAPAGPDGPPTSLNLNPDLLLASLNNDLPVDSETNYADVISGEDEHGTFSGIAWSSADWVDLSINLPRGDMTQGTEEIVLTLASNHEMDVEIWISSEEEYCAEWAVAASSQLLHVTTQRQVFVIPWESFDHHPIVNCQEQISRAAVDALNLIILIAPSGVGELRIYGLQFGDGSE